MELVINEGHLVASLHPSWSPFGRECPSPPPGMGMQGRQLRPSSTQWESFPGFHGQQSMAFSPQSSRNSGSGEAALEQAPDSGSASGLQAVPALFRATGDAAMLQQRGGQTRRETEHLWEPGGSSGCLFLRSGHRGSEAHSAWPSSLC